MAHEFSITASLPTHLKLCPFTQTPAVALLDDATLGTCFARWMTRRGMYSWHQVTPEVLYTCLLTLVESGEALMEGATVQPPLVPTGAWANACRSFLNCVGIWAPELPLLPLPGAYQPADGAAHAINATTAIWTTPHSSILAVGAPAGPVQPGTLEFSDEHVHECIEHVTADGGVVIAVLDHRSSPA